MLLMPFLSQDTDLIEVFSRVVVFVIASAVVPPGDPLELHCKYGDAIRHAF